MIAVVFPNGQQKSVSAEELDALIESRAIERFLRSTGWVNLERDALRNGRPALCIPERRASAYLKFNQYLKALTA